MRRREYWVALMILSVSPSRHIHWPAGTQPSSLEAADASAIQIVQLLSQNPGTDAGCRGLH